MIFTLSVSSSFTWMFMIRWPVMFVTIDFFLITRRMIRLSLLLKKLLSSCFDLLSQADAGFGAILSEFLCSVAAVVFKPFADVRDDCVIVQFAATRSVQTHHTVIV